LQLGAEQIDNLPIDRVELTFVDEEGVAHQSDFKGPFAPTIMTTAERAVSPAAPSQTIVQTNPIPPAISERQIPSTPISQPPQSTAHVDLASTTTMNGSVSGNAPATSTAALPQTTSSLPTTLNSYTQAKPNAVETPPKAIVNYSSLLEKGTVQDWSKLLDSPDIVKLDLSEIEFEEDDYKDPGYRNLLLAIFETNLSKKELQRKFLGDKFTERCVEFLTNLKVDGYVEYTVSGSDIQYADETLSMLAAGNTPATSQVSDTRAKRSFKVPRSKSITFLNSQKKSVDVIREIVMNAQEERPESIRFTMKNGSE
jgi:hypothetical protein